VPTAVAGTVRLHTAPADLALGCACRCRKLRPQGHRKTRRHGHIDRRLNAGWVGYYQHKKEELGNVAQTAGDGTTIAV